MRLPRWMLAVAITLSVLLPVFLAGLWWTNWPVQTAIDFSERLAEGDDENIVKLMPEAGWLMSLTPFQEVYKGSNNVSFLPRTAFDRVCGRARFRVEGIGAHLLAERGRVRIPDRYRLVAILRKQSVILVDVQKSLEILAKERAAFLKDSELGRSPKAELDRGLAERDAQVFRFQEIGGRLALELQELIRKDDNSR